MHRAPAVNFPVVRSHWHLRVLAVALALSAVASVALIGSGAVSGLRSAVMLLAVGSAAVLAGVQWVRTPSGMLRWDGGQWLWETATLTQPCAVQLKLDFQRAVVVQIAHAPGQRRYLWIEQGAAPQRWLALRRALVSQFLHPMVLPDDSSASKSGGRP